jgi:phosphoribosylformylglycinamidine cyclo-ligase
LVRELTPLMSTEELYRTVNMGVGMIVVCAPDQVDVVQQSIAETTWIIGELVAGSGGKSERVVLS